MENTKISTFRKALLVVGTLVAGSISAWALSASHFASSSRMATGHWVKVRCDEAGMQQITYSQLAEWGFTDPEQVRIYGFTLAPFARQRYWESLSDDQNMLPTLRYADATGEKKIIFYSEGQFAHKLTPVSGTKPMQISNEFVLNRYSDAQYFLVSDAPIDRTDDMSNVAVNNNPRTVYTFHRALEFNMPLEYNPVQGGAFSFGKPVEHDYDFNFDVVRPETSATYLQNYGFPRVFFRVGADRPSATGTILASFSLRNEDFGLYNGMDLSASNSKQATLNYHFTNQGHNHLIFNSDANKLTLEGRLTNADKTLNVVKSIMPFYTGLSYLRKNILDNDTPQMMMYFDYSTPASDAFQMANKGTSLDGTATAETYKMPVVWDVTYPDAPRNVRLTTNPIGWRGAIAKFDDYSEYKNTKRLIAFHPDMTLGQPVKVAEVANQNLHQTPTPDYLIITTPTLREAAERLANLHRTHQGLEVKVATSEEIYNEFTSGTPHTMAYRMFVKMLYERGRQAEGANKLRYILLLGSASYDPLNREFPEADRLVVYETENETYAPSEHSCFVTNDYYGDMRDEFDPYTIEKYAPQVPVGHIDAYNLSEANAYIDKVERYLLNPPTNSDIFNRMTFLADSGDGFLFFRDGEEVAATVRELQPGITISKMYNALYDYDSNGDASYLRHALSNSLQQGRYIWSYSGHSNDKEFKSTQMLWNNNSTESVEITNPPHAIFGTCEVYSFDRLSENMVHGLMVNRNGGIITALSASRSVLSTFNQYLHLEYIKALLTARPGDKVGDAYLKAKTNVLGVVNKDSNRINARCYNLAGDPALPLVAVDRYVGATKITLMAEAGEVSADVNPIYTEQTPGAVAVNALQQFTIEGCVTTDAAMEQVDTSFTGPIYISIYDSAVNRQGNPIAENGNNKNKKVYADTEDDLLTRVCAQVVDGRFVAHLIVPEGAIDGEFNRITFLALDADTPSVASGATVAVCLKRPDEVTTVKDDVAPTIDELYIDSPEFVSGDAVASDFVLYALLNDDLSGVNTATSGLGSEPLIGLDGTLQFANAGSFLTPQTDGSVKLRYPISNIANGEHTLTLAITDRAGNSTSASIDFVVGLVDLTATLTVEENTVREAATFQLQLADDSLTPDVKIVIRDAHGATVCTLADATFPAEWDLRDSRGALVANGRYTAVAMLRQGSLTESTDPVEFIVVK